MYSSHVGIFTTTSDIENLELNDENLMFLINFNDHLQIIKTFKNKNAFTEISNVFHLSNELNNELQFDTDDMDKNFYTNTCPSNSGFGFKISAILDIPLCLNNGNTNILCNRWSLRLKKLETGFHELLSKQKIGVELYSFLNSFIVKVCSFIKLEDKLSENSSYVIKKLDMNSVTQSSLKNTYSYFFEQYKFVCSLSKDGKSYLFNEQFISNSQENKEYVNSKIGNYYSDLFLTDYNSIHVFIEFIKDYITNVTGINMVDYYSKVKNDTSKEEYSKLLEIDKILKAFNDEHKKFSLGNVITFYRNIKHLDFFNLNNEYLLSENEIAKLTDSIKKDVKLDLEISENNYIFTNDSSKCTINFASLKSLKGTNGNHIAIKSNSLKLAINVLECLEKHIEVHNDIIFGKVSRDPLFSGLGFKLNLVSSDFDKVEAKNKIENLRTISSKEDYDIGFYKDNDNMFINKDDLFMETSFTIGTSVDALLEKTRNLLNELKHKC